MAISCLLVLLCVGVAFDDCFVSHNIYYWKSHHNTYYCRVGKVIIGTMR